MAKEILLYGNVNEHSAASFIEGINGLEQNEDLSVRVHTNGGSPEALFGMIAKYLEFEGPKKVKVDGKAMSAGFYFVCYTEDVESLDVSRFLIHRASYAEWFERDHMTEDQKKALIKTNKDLRKAFENKVDVKLFEETTKVKVDDIFSMDSRVDVEISAQTAKKIGLISKINPITPKKRTSLNANFQKIAAEFGTTIELLEINTDISDDIKNNGEKKSVNMTIQEFQVNHPDLFSEVSTIGATAEKERVMSWLELSQSDPKAVQEGIESGAVITTSGAIKILKEAQAQASAAAEAQASAAENQDPLDTEKPDESGEEVTTLIPGSKYITSNK